MYVCSHLGIIPWRACLHMGILGAPGARTRLCWDLLWHGCAHIADSRSATQVPCLSVGSPARGEGGGGMCTGRERALLIPWPHVHLTPRDLDLFVPLVRPPFVQSCLSRSPGHSRKSRAGVLLFSPSPNECRPCCRRCARRLLPLEGGPFGIGARHSSNHLCMIAPTMSATLLRASQNHRTEGGRSDGLQHVRLMLPHCVMRWDPRLARNGSHLLLGTVS